MYLVGTGPQLAGKGLSCTGCSLPPFEEGGQMNCVFVFKPTEKELTRRWRPSLAEVIFVASG